MPRPRSKPRIKSRTYPYIVKFTPHGGPSDDIEVTIHAEDGELPTLQEILRDPNCEDILERTLEYGDSLQVFPITK